VNIRHAAALALAGWYLMVPPDLADLAPISAWRHFGSYDSARKCDSARSQLGIDAVKDENASGCKTEQSEHCFLDFAKENARCVATDDPRLKPK
jgi:hypothetical protein